MAQNFLSDIKLGDSIFIRLGDSTYGDLRIQHNGTNSFFDNHTGNLYVRNYSDDKNIHFQTDNGSGSVTDYIVIHGGENIVKFQEHTRHLDSKEARFGTGSDLIIHHNSVNSFIQNSNGNLYIDNDADDADIYLRSDDGNGGKTAYFYLDGSAVNTRFVQDIKFSDSVKALFGGSSDLEIYHDGTNSIINDNGTGNLQFQIAGTPIFDVTSDGITMAGWPESDYELKGDIDGGVRFDAQAGEALSKGDVVYISGAAGDNTVVSKAQANSASTMPAFGLVLKDAANGAACQIVTFGNLYGSGAAALDTSTCSVGDEIFVSAATAGEWTKTAPTGESNLVQKIGKILRVATSNGVIKVSGAGRSNATPNLNTGRLFVGNASNQAVADGTMYVDIANSRVGIGNTSPAKDLVINNATGAQLQLQLNSNDRFRMEADSFGGSFYSPAGYGARFFTSGSERLRIASDGTITLNAYGAGYLKTDANGVISVDTDTIEDTLQSVTDRGASTTNRITFSNGIDVTGGTTGADIYINNTSPTLGFTDSNSFTDANDIYIIRGTSGDKLQFQWYDDSASTTTETFNIDSSGNATFAGDITVSKTDPKITLFDNSGANTDPSGSIVFSESSGVENFDITYNGTDDRLEFRGRVGGSDNVDLMYISRQLTTPLQVQGGATFAGDVTTDKIKGATYPSNSFLDFDYDQTAASNTTALTSIARINYIADTNGNDGATSAGHVFYTGTTDIDTATELLVIKNNGDATFSGNVNIGAYQLQGTSSASNYLDFDDDSTTHNPDTNVTTLASVSGIAMATNLNDGGGGDFTVSTGSTGTQLFKIAVGGNATFGGNIMPSADSTHNIGSNSVRWDNVYADNLYGIVDKLSVTANDTFTGTYSLLWHSGNVVYSSSFMTINGATDTLSVPNISTTGDVSVGGDLNVTGSINQSNITNLQVDDKTITLNFGSGDTSSTANGSGIIIQDAVDASTDATILWDKTNAQFDFNQKVHVTASGSILLLLENSATSGADSKIRIRGARNAQTYSDGSLLSSLIFSNHDSDDSTVNHDLGEIGVGMYDGSGNTGYLRLKVNNGSGLQTALDIDKNKDAKFLGKVGIGSLNTSYNLYNNGTSYFNDEVTIDSTVRLTDATAGLIYSPQESGVSQQRYFIMFDNTNDASYPFLTNRTPNGAVVIKTGTAAAGGENEHFRIKGGDGTVDAYFTNVNLGIGTTSPSELLTLNKASGAVGILLEGNGTDVGKFKVASAGVNHAVQFGTISNNEIQFHTADAEKMRITSGGLVGIGTTNPTGLLHVYGDTNSNGGELYLQINNNNTTDNIGTISFGNNVGVALSRIQAQTSGANNNSNLAFFTSTGATRTQKMVITNSGEVGIGTASPDAKLMVNTADQLIARFKSSNTGTTGIRIQGVDTSNSDAVFVDWVYDAENRKYGFGEGTASGELPINSGLSHCDIVFDDAKVGIGTASPQAALHVAGAFNSTSPTGNGVLMGYYLNAYGYIQLNGTSGGYIDFSTSGTDHKGRILYDNTSNYLRFDTDGAERMRITSGGKVGIDVENPDAELQVGPNQNSNATGISFAAGSSVGNLIARTTTHHNWFPYSDGNNYYSAGTHTFRNGSHSTNYLTLTSSLATFTGAITLAGTLTNNVAQASASVGNTVTLTKINSNNAYTEYTGFLNWTYSGTGSNPYTFNLVFDAGTLDVAYEVVLRTGRNSNWRNFGAMKDFGYIYNESDGDFKHNAEGDVTIASGLDTYRFSLDSDPVGFGAIADNNTSDTASSGVYSKFIRRYSFNFENNTTGSDAQWEIYVKVYNFAGDIKFLKA